MAAENIIKVSGITKTYKKGGNLFDKVLMKTPLSRTVKALDRISFDVKEGEILAILGPNGAGKTTLLKLLASLLIADEGDIYFKDINVARNNNNFKKYIGFMNSEEPAFYWRLSIQGNLEFYAAMYNMTKRDTAERIEQLCRFFDIDTPEKRFQECSSGVKQRAALARSLLHNPELIILDEPTRSLDPLSALEIRDYIQRLAREEKKTVILSTHNTMEAEKIADRIIIIDKGELTAMGDLEYLKSRFGTASSGLDELFSKIIKKDTK